MTRYRDPDDLLKAYLADGMDVLPDRVVDAVLDEAHRTRQRTVFGPWRPYQMNSAIKLALAAAAVVVVVVAGVNLLPRQGGGIGGPGAATPSPVVTPSPTPSPKSIRLTVAGSPLSVTAQVPAGWETSDFAANDSPVRNPGQVAFFTSLVDNTFVNPCAHIQRSPKVGATVQAAATALGEIPGVTASDPVKTTIAGHDATYIELAIPASLPCSPDKFYLWQDSPDGDWWALELNETVRVWIIDLGGRPVAIAARSWPRTSDAAKAELQAALDSIAFDTNP